MKQSKKELAESYEACDTERVCTSFALQASLDKEVEWVRNSFGSVGIVRADSAGGGVVIVRAKSDNFPRCYYLETWHARTIQRVNQLLGYPMANDDALLLDAERALAHEVMAKRNAMIEISEVNARELLARGGK